MAMTYLRPCGELVLVPDPYQIDITPDILEAGQGAIPNLQMGQFPEQPEYPAAVCRMSSAGLGDYVSNRARGISFVYAFEIKALTEQEKEENLCSALSRIYEARRSQYKDACGETVGVYIKRITFTFKIRLGV